MKIIALLLAILCAILATLLIRQGGSATTVTEGITKSRDGFSNRVDVLTTKLMAEQGTTAFTSSNLQFAVDRRTSEVHFFSNRVVQTLLRLNDAQREARAAQGEVQNALVRLTALDGQREELARRLELIPTLQKELLETKLQLGHASLDRDELIQSLSQLRLEQAGLERMLDDPALLEIQLKKAEDAARIRKQTASGRRVDLTDPRVTLALQPDGTVRAVASTQETSRK